MAEMTSKQLPTIVRTGALAPFAETYLLPSLIAVAGDRAAWRYVEFLTANIRNANTQRA